jgi:hypothetical protein
VIETDEQRRWWFATHPEYSWSQKGTHPNAKADNQDPIDPKEVDSYVDDALKHVDGPVADLLKSVKRHYGTEAELLKQWERVLGAWEGTEEDVQVDFAQHLYEYDTLPRLPTLDELSGWPREIVRQFFRWLDALWAANNIISDPNAPHNHHRLVKKLTKYFMNCGLDVDMYIRIMKAGDHMRLHKGKGRGGDWNREWIQFSRQWPADKSEEHQRRIGAKLKEMEERYGVANKGFKWPPNLKPPL